MANIFLIILILIILYLSAKFLIDNKISSIPGPIGWPIVGSYFDFRKRNSPIILTAAAKKYGNVFSLKVGINRIVVICGYKAIKEALLDKASHFAGRPLIPVYKMMAVRGIAFTDVNEVWKSGRKEMMKIIINFCNTKCDLFLESLRLSSQTFIASLQSSQNNPFDPIQAVTFAIIDLTMHLTCKDCTEDDIKRLASFIKVENLSLALKPFNFWNHFPWLKPIAGFHKEIKNLKCRLVSFEAYIIKFIDKRKESFDSNNIEDVLDAFLALKSNPKINLSDDMINGLLAEFVMVSLDTTIATLYWVILLMAAYPEVQIKVQQEIDNIIKSNRRPTVLDRGTLPYTEATINECQRYAAVIYTLYHKATKDTDIQGIKIKKDSIILPHFKTALHDESVWENPEKFEPNRFLNANNELNSTATDKLLQYGAGLRRCTGEVFARWTLFHYFVNLLQSCTIEAAPGYNPHLYLKNYIDGIIFHLHSYKVKIKPRYSI